MKRLLGILITVAFAMACFSGQALARVGAGDFPEKGWHKGPYLLANVGLIQVTNDKHIVTNGKFDGKINPAYGITFGWDIADWIGPVLTIDYSTATSNVGTATGAAGTFPAGTFTAENARQHVLDFTIAAKATLPYFTKAAWQPKNIKFIPYAKLGATGHALFVNAPTDANKVGAVGGGPAIGLGLELFIWKGLVFNIDATEHLILQKAFYRTSAGTRTKVTDGGFKPHFSLLGGFGWHF